MRSLCRTSSPAQPAEPGTQGKQPIPITSIYKRVIRRSQLLTAKRVFQELVWPFVEELATSLESDVLSGIDKLIEEDINLKTVGEKYPEVSEQVRHSIMGILARLPWIRKAVSENLSGESALWFLSNVVATERPEVYDRIVAKGEKGIEWWMGMAEGLGILTGQKP